MHKPARVRVCVHACVRACVRACTNISAEPSAAARVTQLWLCNVHAHIHACTDARTHAPTHPRTHGCICMHKCVRMRAYTRIPRQRWLVPDSSIQIATVVQACTFVHASVCACLHASGCVCIRTHACVYIQERKDFRSICECACANAYACTSF